MYNLHFTPPNLCLSMHTAVKQHPNRISEHPFLTQSLVLNKLFEKIQLKHQCFCLDQPAKAEYSSVFLPVGNREALYGGCTLLDRPVSWHLGACTFLDWLMIYLFVVRTFLDGVRNFLDGARTFLDGARNFLDGHMTYALIRWKCLIAAKTLCI